MDATADGLLRDALTGDREAFGRLLTPLIPAGYRLAVGMLQDQAEAEDVVQEASIKAWRRLGTFHPDGRLLPWFLGIVANECRTVRRGRWWAVIRRRDPVPGGTGGAPVPRDDDVDRALRRLPFEQRLVVVLHYYFDLPLADVAGLAGAPVGTVKSRLHRALAALRVDAVLAEERA